MDKIDNLYEFSYHYVETPVEHRDGFNDKRSWYYPELENIINGLQQKWDMIDIPLKIEIFDKRILIKHKTPTNIGSLAQLKISAYLAFMLGYTEEIEEFGQYLRFDQNEEYLAPHEPKLFLDYCNRKQLETIESLHDEKVEELFERFTYLLDQIYTKNRHILAKLRAENFVNRKCEKKCETEIKDCRDRKENGITPIEHFELFYDQNWKIKGVVCAFNDDSMTLNPNSNDPHKFFVLQLEDYSSKINISGFDRNAELLSELAVKGVEYYLTKTDDQSDITVTIHNNLYKVKFEVVNK